jgi:hypothetical protein
MRDLAPVRDGLVVAEVWPSQDGERLAGAGVGRLEDGVGNHELELAAG